MQALALIKESSLFSHWGRPDDGAAAASMALEIVPNEARDIRMRIRGNLAITKSWHTRPLEETQRELMRVTAEAMELGLEHYVAIGFHNLGQIQYEMGELANARKSLERAAEFWNQPASGPFADNFNLVVCLLAQGETSRAAEYAVRGITATDGWPRLQAEASCGLAQVHMTAGNFAQATRTLEGHVFGRRDLGASTEMVLVTYLRSKLLSAEADSAMSEAAARLGSRQLDPRQAPTTQAVLAAVEHTLGVCQSDCGEGALAKALEWKGRGAALMSAEALLIAAPALLAHRVSRAPAAVGWAIRTIIQIGVARRYIYWLRRLGEGGRVHRMIEASLWPDLIAQDPRTWSTALLQGGIAHLEPEARAAAIAAVEAHSSSGLLPILAAVETPDLIASRQRILVKHSDRFFVHSFGKLSVHRGGWEGPSIEIHKKRERALLGFLVAHFGESISRDTVLDALWPDTPPAAAVNNLNQTMFQLRRMLDPDYKDGVSAPYVMSGPESIELHPDLVRVDWHELTRRLRSSASGSAGPPAHPMKLAARLIRGGFLQEALYDDWSAAARQRVHDTLRGALLPMTTHQSVSTDLRVRLAECLVTLDEFDELAHASLARALAESGRRVAALRVVREVTARLREEQIEPSAPLATVIRELSPTGRVASELTDR